MTTENNQVGEIKTEGFLPSSFPSLLASFSYPTFGLSSFMRQFAVPGASACPSVNIEKDRWKDRSNDTWNAIWEATECTD